MGRVDTLSTVRTLLALTVLGAAATATAAAAQEAPPVQNGDQSAQAQSTGSAVVSAPLSADASNDEQDAETEPLQDQTGRSAVSPTPVPVDRQSFEIGVEPRFISNYFEAQDEFNSGVPATPAKSVGIITVSGSYNYNIVQKEDSTVTAGVRLRHNFFTNLPHADSTDFDASLDYHGKSSQLNIGYFGTWHRLVSIVNGKRIYDTTNGFTAEYLRNLSSRLRARVRYRFSHEGYSDFTDRNLSENEFSADLRYRISPYFMPGIGYDYMHADGKSNLFSYDRYAPFVTVTSEIGKLAYLSFRYRHLDRHYSTDVPADSHFGRRDNRDQFTFYGTVWLGHGFSVFGYADHINNHSNVSYANFKTTEGGLGLFYRFD